MTNKETLYKEAEANGTVARLTEFLNMVQEDVDAQGLEDFGFNYVTRTDGEKLAFRIDTNCNRGLAYIVASDIENLVSRCKNGERAFDVLMNYDKETKEKLMSAETTYDAMQFRGDTQTVKTA